jgi:hypothetical protein
MNTAVTKYIEEAAGPQAEAMRRLRQLIHATVPGIQEEFKWGRPVFRAKKDLAYFKTTRAYLTLGFFHTQQLDDPDGLLEGTGKDMRHIKIRNADAINEELIKSWLETLARG